MATVLAVGVGVAAAAFFVRLQQEREMGEATYETWL